MTKSNLLKVYSLSLKNSVLDKVRKLSNESIKVKPHIPLIRFRKNENDKLVSSELNLSSSTPSSMVMVNGFEEDMTPIKYRRKTLTQLEIEVIESGGLYT